MSLDEIYCCPHCKYATDNKYHYARHIQTQKHKNNVSCSIIYFCKSCAFSTTNKKDYKRHLLRQKHILKVQHDAATSCENVCCYCNKKYTHASSLSRHKLKCNQNTISTNQVTNILEQQQTIFGEQQTMMSEIMAKVTENCSITNITNNTTNNTTNNNDNKFNLNIFLNETCKNAMTLEHFLNNLQIEIEDIEYVGNHGYVEGMSHIITERLNALDITERPIHCTDMKRETMHIKCEDAWHKDVDDEKINSLVGIVAKLNYRKLPDWREQHPHFLDSSNPDFDYHMKMLGNILGAQQNANIDKKVIKNIAKHISLDKPRLAMKYK